MNALKKPALALASAGLGLSAVALGAAPAHAVAVDKGHFDFLAEVTCASGNTPTTVDLVLENHDDGTIVSSPTIEVDNDTTAGAVSGATTALGVSSGTAIDWIDPNSWTGSTGLEVGFEAEYVGCSGTPNVTFTAVTTPPGTIAGQMAAFDSSGTAYILEPGVGAGLTTTTHVDKDWGFTSTGTYPITVRARSGGGSGPSDTLPVVFSVS